MTLRQLATAVLLASGFSACRDRAPDLGAGAEQPDTGGTLVVAIPNELDAVNSLLSGERYGQEINRNVLYLPLVQYDPKLDIEPLLAESWQMHGDTAVTFKLRRDVYWHDGVRTSAHDVAFTFERGKDPQTGYPNGDYWVGWKAAQVVDSFTVHFSIDPQPDVLANLPWIPIMPAHLLSSIPAAELKNAPFNQQPVGNGPFRFVEHRANDRWVFDANRSYPAALGGRPLVDRLIIRIVPDRTAQLTELLTGNVHFITSVDVKDFARLEQQPQVHGVEKPGRQYMFVAWNTKREPFADQRFRRALTFATNRDEILQIVRGSYGEVAAGPVPPYHWSNDATIEPLPFRPDSARAIFNTLGLRDVNQDGYLELPDGKELRIELKHVASSESQRDIAEMMRADLQDVGIRLVARPLEASTMYEDVTSAARNFDAVVLGFENDFRLVLHDMFHSRALANPYQFASYRNPAVDSLLDRLAVTAARSAAIPMWRRLQTIIRDEQPWTFLFYFSDLFGARDELKGPKGDIRGIFVDVSRWWLARPDTATTTR